MGGFFITNAPDAISVAERTFAGKPAGRDVTQRSAMGVELRHWTKANANLGHPLHEDSRGWIVGCGTYYRDQAFGPACLAALWDAFVARGPSVFSEVNGHFAFVVFHEGRMRVVTDKVGTYHVHVARQGQHFYISTSFIAIANALPSVTLSKQEALEFINVETTLGRRTLFQEIQHAEAGVLMECQPSLATQSYYDTKDVRLDFDQLVDRLDQYHRVFSHVGALPCSDLSGGHDSRTVVAVLAHAGVDFACNTNRNLTDSQDHEIALRVADYLHKPVTMYENRVAEFDHEQLVDQMFTSLEVARNVYGGAYTPVYMREKSQANALVFGGYGGELLRDVYARAPSLPELIRQRYRSTRVWLPKRTDAVYREALLGKFEHTLQDLGEHDIKKSCEKIYYFEKMRYWGGSRITAFNQYCYRAHPLLDHTLVKHYFDFPLEDKARAKLQRRLMELVPGLSRIPLSSEVGTSVRGRGIKKLKRLLHERQLEPSGDFARLVRHLRQRDDYVPPAKLTRAREKVTPALLSFLGLTPRDVIDAALFGRMATLGYLVEHFRDKVRGL